MENNMENNIENNIENKMDMKGDDAAMVDDILNSLRDGSPNNNQMPPNMQMQQQQQQMPPNMQMQQQQQMPPNMQMQQQMHPNMQMQQQMAEMPSDVEVEYDSNDSKVNKVLTMMKKPLIIIALAFILFNPFTTDKLANYLPTVFGVTNSLIRKQVRVLCLALILGLLFLGINNVL
jgi:hypothetical protein